jgi:hypothetical protein
MNTAMRKIDSFLSQRNFHSRGTPGLCHPGDRYSKTGRGMVFNHSHLSLGSWESENLGTLWLHTWWQNLLFHTHLQSKRKLKAWWSPEPGACGEIIPLNQKNPLALYFHLKKNGKLPTWPELSGVFQDSLCSWHSVLNSSWVHSYLSHHVFLTFSWENMAPATIKLEQLRYFRSALPTPCSKGSKETDWLTETIVAWDHEGMIHNS